MVKFSIITPVYNVASYLDKFLDSVINQTFSQFELILIDDGSTDESLEICKAYAQKDSRLQLFTQTNQGAGKARNNGLKHAKGQYVLFFDSDDWIDNSALQVLNDAVHQTPTDLLIFGAQEILFDAKENEIGTGFLIPKKSEFSTKESCRQIFGELIFSSFLNVPWNKVYRKEIIDKHLIEFPDARRAQDAFFNMEYYRYITSLRIIDNSLYYYRTNTLDKIWRKFPKDLYKIDIQYDKYLVNIFDEFNIYTGENKNRVDTLFFNSLLRTVGFCRNPKWKMSMREKKEYVNTIIINEYNVLRARKATAINKRSKRIRKYILSKNEKGLLCYFYKSYIWEMMYNFYVKKIKTIIKGVANK